MIGRGEPCYQTRSSVCLLRSKFSHDVAVLEGDLTSSIGSNAFVVGDQNDCHICFLMMLHQQLREHSGVQHTHEQSKQRQYQESDEDSGFEHIVTFRLVDRLHVDLSVNGAPFQDHLRRTRPLNLSGSGNHKLCDFY